MKKSQLKKKLTELKKVLTSDKAIQAIGILAKEVENYVEKPQKTAGSKDDFELPKEVQAGQTNFALFTDGACRGNPGPGAWAYLIQDYKGDIIKEDAGVSEQTTNNKMELGAIIEGLKVLSKMATPMHSIYVYTDSKYAVDGMNSWVQGWKRRGWKKADKKVPENVDLWKELDVLATESNIYFNWVKGHAGHPQNEYVDQLANTALDEDGY